MQSAADSLGVDGYGSAGGVGASGLASGNGVCAHEEHQKLHMRRCKPAIRDACQSFAAELAYSAVPKCCGAFYLRA